MKNNFLVQHILLGDLTLKESMLNSIEFIQSQIRYDFTEEDTENLIKTIDYRWKDGN